MSLYENAAWLIRCSRRNSRSCSIIPGIVENFLLGSLVSNAPASMRAPATPAKAKAA